MTDVYATLAEALELRTPSGLDGASLWSGTRPADRGVYFESYYGYVFYNWSPITGWIDAEGKYLQSSAPEFFRIDDDPREETNGFFGALVVEGIWGVSRCVVVRVDAGDGAEERHAAH